MSQSISDQVAAMKAALASAKTTTRLVTAALKIAPSAPAVDIAPALAAVVEAKDALVEINTDMLAALAGTPVVVPPVVVPPVVVLPSALNLVAQPLSLANVSRAYDLVNRWGVATHCNYNDAQYANVQKIKDSLRYLGLWNFRDTNFNVGDQGQDTLKSMVADGFKITVYLRTGTTPAIQLSRLKQFLAVAPNSIKVIEGPNEVNNEPIAYKGLEGEEAAQLFMEEFYALARVDPVVKNIPIAGFTNWPSSGCKSDMDTIHPYAKLGAQPRATMEEDLRQQRAATFAYAGVVKPFHITETGYHSETPRPSPSWETVDKPTQAKLQVNTLLDAAALGAEGVFIYQLFDDRDGDGQEQHFGLFDFTDYAPNPAATAIGVMTGLLKDTGATAKTFEPVKLDASVSGAPDHGRSLQVQKSDGSYVIVTWAEGDCWDEDADKPLASPVFNQTISFGRTFKTVTVHDPLIGAAPIATLSNVSSVVVGVSDHALIVKLSD